MMTIKARALLSTAILALALAPQPAPSAGGIALVPVSEVFARLSDPATRSITLAAWSLRSDAPITNALVAAADRGAQVSVALGRGTFGYATADNAATTALFKNHKPPIRVHESPTESHIKAVEINGTGLYLTDRNFASRDERGIVVLDTFPDDRLLVERAFLGQPGSNDHLWTRKADALDAEARLIGARGSRNLRFSTESISQGTPVFEALLARRQAGDVVRVMVGAAEYNDSSSRTTRQAVSALRAAGIGVRSSDADEKYVVDGDDVYIGSANASRGRAGQIEFGIAMRDNGLGLVLAQQYDAEWGEAHETL